MARPTTPRAKGFTFIEVLAALAIASIALLGLLKLHLLSMATADAAQELSQAVFVAQEQLAEASAPDYPRRGTTSGTIERNGLQFIWRTEITDATGHDMRSLALRGLRQIQTTVTWEREGDRKSTQMTTYVANTGNPHD